MKKLIALLLLLPGLVLADEARVRWTNPTTNTNGTAIPASGPGSLTETRVEYGTCDGTGFGTATGEVRVPAPATETTITGFEPGMTVCFRNFARNTYGNESGPSNIGTKTFPTPTPQPPVLTVVPPVAYEIKRTPEGLVKLGRDVGNVMAGTECSEVAFVANNHGTFYAVPTEAVTLYRKPRSQILVALCDRNFS